MWLPVTTRSTLIFFFNDTATTEIYTLSLHDALPILNPGHGLLPAELLECMLHQHELAARVGDRSEEHTSELQSQSNLVCRLLLEKKKRVIQPIISSLSHASSVSAIT